MVRFNRKFYAASMQEGANLMKHLNYMTSLAKQLRELKEDRSMKKFATVIWGSLPESYDNFLTSLNARDAQELEWANIKGLLIEEFMKKRRRMMVTRTMQCIQSDRQLQLSVKVDVLIISKDLVDGNKVTCQHGEIIQNPMDSAEEIKRKVELYALNASKLGILLRIVI